MTFNNFILKYDYQIIDTYEFTYSANILETIYYNFTWCSICTGSKSVNPGKSQPPV